MRGEDARYVDNNGDDDQANTRLRGSFFFSLSLLSVPPSRVTLLVTVRLLREFPFLPTPPPFFFLFFSEKNISFNCTAGSQKGGPILSHPGVHRAAQPRSKKR